ncbi:MAG: glucose-6-phosphate dehydrogenase [Gammaproteobacteria bacterium]|nr:glucose-6-phosphate dehydrogenase [Gammaproteobacteria bacterium]
MTIKEEGEAFSSESGADRSLSEPCVMVIFGASGDLTKRLLVPSLYNLACDGLLSPNFAVLGTGRSKISNEAFRSSMASQTEGLRAFHTRNEFDEGVSDELLARFYFESANIDVESFTALKKTVQALDKKYQAGGNILFYFAMAPRFFGTLCENLYKAGFQEGSGWKRIIVEKPFGTNLQSALALNDEILQYWKEEQIFRIDHYLGKETVQNLLAFRFSNGMFEPLWNKHHIDNIQFNVCEAVDVQGRGGYYDQSGVLRDMMQNHMFQMLSYICMEPPGSFEADSIRNEKAKLLDSVRVYTDDEVRENVVRGQYGPAFDEHGDVVKFGYREEADVDPQSKTETFVAAKILIDNLRWQGVPIYLRSGKALWKRGTEIVIEFKKPPEMMFKGTGVENLTSNRLVFHIQPFQGIDLLFQAKTPGPTMRLQAVDMNFNYGEAFKSSRYTGYEVMLYACSRGDATLFSRGDLVEAAWRIAQPLLDHWEVASAPEFPNYTRNSWGPKSAYELLEKDGRRWYEVVTPDVLEESPLFKGADPLLLSTVILALRSATVAPGETIIRHGELATEMYFICRGEVDVLDKSGDIIGQLQDGEFFGEVALLLATPRTADIRARTLCDLFILSQNDFKRILRDHPQFAERILQVAKERYDLAISEKEFMALGSDV